MPKEYWKPDAGQYADLIYNNIADDAMRECGRASYGWADSITFDDVELLESYIQNAFEAWLADINKEIDFFEGWVVEEES